MSEMNKVTDLQLGADERLGVHLGRSLTRSLQRARWAEQCEHSALSLF